MMTRQRPLVASILALLLISGAAHAQPTTPDRDAARALAHQGQEALEKKDFLTAAERFARADEIVHAPTLMLGLARAQVGLGKWLAALEIYQRIVREGAPEGSPPAFLRAIGDAKKEADALEPRIPGAGSRSEYAFASA